MLANFFPESGNWNPMSTKIGEVAAGTYVSCLTFHIDTAEQEICDLHLEDYLGLKE